MPQTTGDPQIALQQLAEMLKGQGLTSPLTIPTVPGQSSGFTPSFDPSRTPTPIPQQPKLPMVPFQSQPQGQTEFRTKGGARSAGIQSFGANLTSLINTVEQRQHDKKAALAEGYVTQIHDLLNSGDPQDRQKAMALLEDSKIAKTLKDGLGYEQAMEPSEPPSPEQVGVYRGMQKVAKKGQQGGPQPGMQPILPHADPVTQARAAFASAMLEKMKKDPSSIGSMGTALGFPGNVSSLSGSQISQAEQAAAGLIISPKEMAGMDLSRQIETTKVLGSAFNTILRANEMQARVDAMMAVAKMQTEGRTADVEKQIQGMMDRAKLVAGTQKDLRSSINSFLNTKDTRDMYKGLATTMLNNKAKLQNAMQSNPSMLNLLFGSSGATQQMIQQLDNMSNYYMILGEGAGGMQPGEGISIPQGVSPTDFLTDPTSMDNLGTEQ